jgi:putative transposase
LGFWSLFLNPRRIQSAAVIIRPSTFLKFHNILKKRKYRLLYSSGKKAKPGPKGPSVELIQAIVELKQRNPRFGCLRIAQQINKAFERQISTKTSSGESFTGLGLVATGHHGLPS